MQKYNQIAAALNAIKAVEEKICWATRRGQNASPLHYEKRELEKQLALIK